MFVVLAEEHHEHRPGPAPGAPSTWGDSSPPPPGAGATVDFPEPFSPTRKVTARSKLRPCSAMCHTAGRVNGHTGRGRASRGTLVTNRPPTPPVGAGSRSPGPNRAARP